MDAIPLIDEVLRKEGLDLVALNPWCVVRGRGDSSEIIQVGLPKRVWR